MRRLLNHSSWFPFLLAVAVGLLYGLGSSVVSRETPRVLAQAAPVGAQIMCNAGTATGNLCTFSPTQLAVNALVLPAMGSDSALSSIVDTRGAREAVLHAKCTQGPWDLNVQTYAEDGSTVSDRDTPLTAVASSATLDFALGSEANPASNTGTLDAAIFVRLPQRALAFSFTNGGMMAGTCTARLFLEY